MKPRCVIWDWNGTLLDDLQLCLRLLNELLEESGCPNRYDLEGYREIFGFPVVDYYRRAGLDLEKRSFESLAADYVARYDPASFSCSLCPGAADALAALKSAGVRQVILSASELTLLKAQTEHLGVEDTLTSCWARLTTTPTANWRWAKRGWPARILTRPRRCWWGTPSTTRRWRRALARSACSAPPGTRAGRVF